MQAEQTATVQRGLIAKVKTLLWVLLFGFVVFLLYGAKIIHRVCLLQVFCSFFKIACMLLSVAAEDVEGVDFLLYIVERAVVAVGDDCL